jgi:heme A synthase
MSRISFKAVWIGAVTDMVSSTISGALIAIAFVVILHLTRIPSDPLDWTLLKPENQNSLLYCIQVIVGAACSVLAGFVAAWVAQHDELLNGALSSFACVLLGILAVAADKDPHLRLTHILLLIASPLFGLLGGYIRHRLKTSQVRQL